VTDIAVGLYLYIFVLRVTLVNVGEGFAINGIEQLEGNGRKLQKIIK
jgi:hypothetical protein